MKGYSNRRDFAAALNMNYATYRNKEQGLSDFTLDEAKIISDFLGRTIENVFYEEEIK